MKNSSQLIARTIRLAFGRQGGCFLSRQTRRIGGKVYSAGGRDWRSNFGSWALAILLAAHTTAGQNAAAPSSSVSNSSLHAPVGAGSGQSKPTLISVIGAGGEAQYAESFAKWSTHAKKAALQGAATSHEIGLAANATAGDGPATDLDQIKALLEAESKSTNQALWILLIGHGTFDGREPKFNLRGPDLAASQLTAWLAPIQRPVAIILCASSSGAFLKPLSKLGRVIVTATKSGSENNYSRFGEHFTAALANQGSDLDKDGQNSLLEAFLYAAASVRDFYKTDNRLASEHPLLDDNGDGLGTPAEWFRGVHAAEKSKDGGGVDGRRAHQFHMVTTELEQGWDPGRKARRDELELQVWGLRDRKSQLTEADYYAKLEELLLEIARITAGTVK